MYRPVNKRICGELNVYTYVYIYININFCVHIYYTPEPPWQRDGRERGLQAAPAGGPAGADTASARRLPWSDYYLQGSFKGI